MGRKKHKKHPEQRSQTKGEQTPINNDLPHKSNLKVAISHAFSSGWVQNSGVGFLLFLIALIVAIMTSTQVKNAALTFALAGTLFLWILAGIVIRYVNESKQPELMFSLLFKTFDGSHSKNSGLFWFRYPSGYGDTLSPASAALYMTVKNPRTLPAYIERMEIDVQKKGNKWSVLRDIPAEGGRMYWIYGDATKAALLNMPLLSSRISSSIPAGETVSGWVFLAVTKEYPVAEGDLIRWRVRVKDSAGEKSEYISPSEPVNNKPESDPAKLQPVPIPFTGKVEDLSGLVFRNFEPFPYK